MKVIKITEFKIDDKIYSEFKTWLETKDFDYTTDSEKVLEKLKEVAEEEKYFARIKPEFEALEGQVKHNKARDLEDFQDEVKDLLRGEIISRYYHQRGRIEALLQEDPEVAKALDILASTEDYKRILTDKGSE